MLNIKYLCYIFQSLFVVIKRGCYVPLGFYVLHAKLTTTVKKKHPLWFNSTAVWHHWQRLTSFKSRPEQQLDHSLGGRARGSHFRRFAAVTQLTGSTNPALPLGVVHHQPALGARLCVLSAQWLPQTHLHLHSAAGGLATVHHLRYRARQRGAVGMLVCQSERLALTSTISLISLCVSSLSSLIWAVPIGLSLRRKPLVEAARAQVLFSATLPQSQPIDS